MPGRYRPEQAKATWQQIISFLNTVLDRGWSRERIIWCGLKGIVRPTTTLANIKGGLNRFHFYREPECFVE